MQEVLLAVFWFSFFFVCHGAPKQPRYLLLHHSTVTHDTKKYPRVFDAPDTSFLGVSLALRLLLSRSYIPNTLANYPWLSKLCRHSWC